MVTISDGLNFLSKLTFRRAVNAVNMLVGYHYSRFTKKHAQWGWPMSMAVEPTTSCNLRCPECPSGLGNFTRATGMLEENFFRQIIDENSSHLLYLTFYFQGEPYLNPRFLEMVKYAAAKKIYTSTSTNAHYLDNENSKKTVESGLDRLIISIDGATQDAYAHYRIGGELKKVIEGTTNIIRWKKTLKSKTPHVIFQFLVVKPNEHQTDDVKSLAKELGVNEVKFKTAQIYDYENGSNLIPDNKKFSRYFKNGDGKFHIKNPLDNHCWKMWHSAVITWDGTVVPCCFDKDARHRLGSLKEKSFKEIWMGEGYKNFRSSLLRSRKEIDICKNCSEGTAIFS